MSGTAAYETQKRFSSLGCNSPSQDTGFAAAVETLLTDHSVDDAEDPRGLDDLFSRI